MPALAQQRAIDLLAPHVPAILDLNEEINSRIRSRRKEYLRLDRHQRKTRVSAERRAHVATGLRHLLDAAPQWHLRREFLDAGRYEWDVEGDVALRLAKRLPVTPQPPAATSTTLQLFDHDAVPQSERDRLLLRLLGDPLNRSATVDVACMLGRRQEWRLELTHIARGAVVDLRRTTPRPTKDIAVPQAKPQSNIRLPAGKASRRRDNTDAQ